MRYFFGVLCSIFLFVNCHKSNSQEIQQVTTKELKVLLEKGKIQLLDVRTPEEISEGYIETAIFANYFDDNFAEIASKKLSKEFPVYLICRSGNRSGKSAKILKEKGYNVYNVVGGFNQWKKEN
ncbi:rhodanese-like domain-containing protein [Polaribacter tangerinus]|uniref:rhodanese-like domain-containing protein n=1 Tax=Polaribacter tangerinus TaxID=1920034 RepID=UPI000B4BCD81|nr:rhodanese-like domain-containing protein [Polaribacter tangerinus]